MKKIDDRYGDGCHKEFCSFVVGSLTWRPWRVEYLSSILEVRWLCSGRYVNIKYKFFLFFIFLIYLFFSFRNLCLISLSIRHKKPLTYIIIPCPLSILSIDVISSHYEVDVPRYSCFLKWTSITWIWNEKVDAIPVDVVFVSIL